MSKQREAFEKFCYETSFGYDWERAGEGYARTATQYAWLSWQASRAATLEEAAEICERVDYILARPDVFVEAIRAQKEKS